MAIVWNPTKESVSTKMQGSWFTFKPEQRKAMDDVKCRFIEEERKETGLVVLPSKFDPMADDYSEGFDKTEEGQAILETLRAKGIENLLAYHKDVIRNNQVSLRRDMAHKYPDGDSARLTAVEMSSGELASLQIVAKYQKAKSDVQDQKVKEINKLLDTVGPLGD